MLQIMWSMYVRPTNKAFLKHISVIVLKLAKCYTVFKHSYISFHFRGWCQQAQQLYSVASLVRRAHGTQSLTSLWDRKAESTFLIWALLLVSHFRGYMLEYLSHSSISLHDVGSYIHDTGMCIQHKL